MILPQSTPMLKSCIYTCFNLLDTVSSEVRKCIVCSFLQDFSNGKGSSLRLICNAHFTVSFYFVGQACQKRNKNVTSWECMVEIGFAIVFVVFFLSQEDRLNVHYFIIGRCHFRSSKKIQAAN